MDYITKAPLLTKDDKLYFLSSLIAKENKSGGLWKIPSYNNKETKKLCTRQRKPRSRTNSRSNFGLNKIFRQRLRSDNGFTTYSASDLNNSEQMYHSNNLLKQNFSKKFTTRSGFNYNISCSSNRRMSDEDDLIVTAKPTGCGACCRQQPVRDEETEKVADHNLVISRVDQILTQSLLKTQKMYNLKDDAKVLQVLSEHMKQLEETKASLKDIGKFPKTFFDYFLVNTTLRSRIEGDIGEDLRNPDKKKRNYQMRLLSDTNNEKTGILTIKGSGKFSLKKRDSTYKSDSHNDGEEK